MSKPSVSSRIAAWLKQAEERSPRKTVLAVLAAVVFLGIAHYAFGDWIANPKVSLWKERAFWSEMWSHALLPVGLWLGWSIVSLGRLKPARFVLALMVVLIAGDAIFRVIPTILEAIDRLQLGLFSTRVENWSWGRYWDWWPLWLPTVLIAGNLALLRNWWRECVQPLLRRKGDDQRGHAHPVLRAAAALALQAAVAMTVLHLGLPKLPANGDVVWLARETLVRPHLRNDFDYLIQHSFSAGEPLAPLLTHLELADVQRRQFYPNLDDSAFQQFILSPEIGRLPLPELNWRRALWEHFYPRVRRESDSFEAARTVVRQLRERVGIDPGYDSRVGVETIWTQQMTDATGFERIYVAALRSVGIASRLDRAGQTELLHAGNWRLAPRPVVASWSTTNAFGDESTVARSKN